MNAAHTANLIPIAALSTGLFCAAVWSVRHRLRPRILRMPSRRNA